MKITRSFLCVGGCYYVITAIICNVYVRNETKFAYISIVPKMVHYICPETHTFRDACHHQMG
jgi:hypothetical protein